VWRRIQLVFSHGVIREACLRLQVNLETVVEFLLRLRRPGLSRVDRWLRPKPARMAPFITGPDTRGRFAVISDRMQYRQHQRQQLGPGPRTPRERTGRARLTKASSYLDEIERLCEFRDRLEEYEAPSPDIERAL